MGRGADVLTIVTWKWHTPGYRSVFTAEHVNVLARMIARNYPHPHRVVCVTDEISGLDSAIDVLPAWNDFADVPSPHGRKNPSCYRRLRLFHPDAEQWFGIYAVSIDLDCVITGDLSPVWNRPEDAVFWGDTNPQPGSHYNGSMMRIRTGSRPQVWTDFDPRRSPELALQARSWGSDQGWLSYKLGPGEAKWGRSDGVYSFRNDIKPTPQKGLPDNARIVFWHGADDPWGDLGQRLPWVREHWA